MRYRNNCQFILKIKNFTHLFYSGTQRLINKVKQYPLPTSFLSQTHVASYRNYCTFLLSHIFVVAYLQGPSRSAQFEFGIYYYSYSSNFHPFRSVEVSNYTSPWLRFRDLAIRSKLLMLTKTKVNRPKFVKAISPLPKVCENTVKCKFEKLSYCIE